MQARLPNTGGPGGGRPEEGPIEHGRLGIDARHGGEVGSIDQTSRNTREIAGAAKYSET